MVEHDEQVEREQKLIEVMQMWLHMLKIEIIEIIDQIDEIEFNEV